MKTFICLFFTLLSFEVYAQRDTTLKFSNSIGGNITGGNYYSYTGNIKSELSKDWKNSQLNWSPNFEYSQISTDGKLQLREREVYSNFNFVKNIKSSKFYFNNEFEHSYLQKVDLRASLGAGLGHKIINSSKFQSDISELIMPEFMMSNFGKIYDNFAIRSSTRLKIKWSNSKSKINFICFYQPSLLTIKDINGNATKVPFNNNVNFRGTVSFETKVSKLWSLGIGNSITYESYSHSIDNSVKPLDYMVYFFIKLN